jgi:hypothetical protein
MEDPHEWDDHQTASDQLARIGKRVDQGDLKDGPVFREGFHEKG